MYAPESSASYALCVSGVEGGAVEHNGPVIFIAGLRVRHLLPGQIARRAMSDTDCTILVVVAVVFYSFSFSFCKIMTGRERKIESNNCKTPSSSSPPPPLHNEALVIVFLLLVPVGHNAIAVNSFFFFTPCQIMRIRVNGNRAQSKTICSVQSYLSRVGGRAY